jgi:hypothetical protein
MNMRKRKMIVAVCIMMSSLTFTGCGNQEELSNLQNANQTLTSEKKDLETKNSELQVEKDKLNADLTKANNDLEEVRKEYNAYKAKMSEYEDLAEAEAEARKIEADRLKAEEDERKRKEQEEAKKEEEKKAAEEEKKAKQGYDTGITYDQLARTPDEYKGEKVKFKGKVVQVIEGDTEIDLRLAVNNDYDKIIYLFYPKDLVSSRVLEDDKITIYGVSYGLYSYESTVGSKITIPLISVDKIDQ